MRAKLRPANKTDLAWITSNWARSARNFSAYSGIPNTIFYHHFQKMMEQVIPRSVVVVYCWDDPDVPEDRANIGYCIYEKSASSIILHFIYVKHLFQGKGFAKTMLQTIMALENRNHIIYTHASRTTLKTHISEKLKAKGWLFNPFELWKLHEIE